MLQTAGGVFLRFSLEEIPQMKKGAKGVRGMKLAKDDMLEKIYLLDENTVITCKEKEVPLSRLKPAKGGTEKGRS